VDDERKKICCEKDIVNRVGLHPMAISILGRMMRDLKRRESKDIDLVAKHVLKELNKDSVLIIDETEEVGEEWVTNWLKELKLEKHVKLLVEIGEYDTKEKILQVDEEQLRSLNKDAEEENVKKIRSSSRGVLLKAVQKERKRDAERRHKCVYACIQMSVKQLNDKMKEWFLRMAVFPEDAIVPMGCLQELWDTKSQQSVIECISKLVGMNLVETTGRKSHYRLHDLCRDYVRFSLSKNHDVGETQMTYVRRFADKKRENLSASSFQKYLFKDGDKNKETREFVKDQMMWHLKDAGMTFGHKEARELLVTLSFSIEWMEMRLGENGDVAAVLKDLKTVRDAWNEWEKKNTEDEGEQSKSINSMATQMRLWLRRSEQVIRTSANIRENPNVLAEEVWQRMTRLIKDTNTNMMTSMVAPWSAMVRNEAQRRRRFVGRMWSEVPWMENVGGAMLGMLKGHSHYVMSVAILNDPTNKLCESGLCVVSGSFDITVRIWDATGREGKDGCLRVFEGHTGDVKSVAILNDSKKQLCKSALCIVSGSSDKTVRMCV